MKKMIYGLLIICFFMISCATQSNKQNVNSGDFGVHFVEKNAGFSMYAPQGWEAVDGGQKYMLLMGPQEDGFSPNIGFFDEQFTGNLSDYSDAVLKLLPQVLADFELIERSDFETNSGKRGERITVQGRINEIQTRQRYYVFQDKKNTAVTGVIGTVALITGTKYDNVFDNSVKTFEWDK